MRDCTHPKGKSSHHERTDGMTMLGHLSMADLLSLVVLWDVPIQKNDDFTVKADHVIASTTLLHTRMHMPFATSNFSFYSYKLMLYVCQFKHWSFNMSQGSLPPADCGSLDIEMFAPPTGVVTPTSVNQFVSSSGPPMTMQLDAALATAGLSKEQAEEIFLLTCEAQKLGRKLVRDFINLSSKEALFCMDVQATGYEKVASGCAYHVTAYLTMIRSEGRVWRLKNSMKLLIACAKRQAKPGWIQTPFSSITLWSIRTS